VRPQQRGVVASLAFRCNSSAVLFNRRECLDSGFRLHCGALNSAFRLILLPPPFFEICVSSVLIARQTFIFRVPFPRILCAVPYKHPLVTRLRSVSLSSLRALSPFLFRPEFYIFPNPEPSLYQCPLASMNRFNSDLETLVSFLNLDPFLPLRKVFLLRRRRESLWPHSSLPGFWLCGSVIFSLSRFRKRLFLLIHALTLFLIFPPSVLLDLTLYCYCATFPSLRDPPQAVLPRPRFRPQRQSFSLGLVFTTSPASQPTLLLLPRPLSNLSDRMYTETRRHLFFRRPPIPPLPCPGNVSLQMF